MLLERADSFFRSGKNQKSSRYPRENKSSYIKCDLIGGYILSRNFKKEQKQEKER